MAETVEIKLMIKPSLVKYFAEGMSKRQIDFSTAEEITAFLAIVLNDSTYPLVSNKTGVQEISLDYRPKAFADPIF